MLFLLVVTLWSIPTELQAQQLQKENSSQEIEGIVKDETGNPVIGATIVAKNQPGLGITTNLDGKFKIKVGEYDVLVISYIGYTTQELPVTTI